MPEQAWKQLFPNPGLNPGFTVDPKGRARFLVEGFIVDVVVKYVDDDEHDDAVEMTATVKLADVMVAEETTRGEWGESYVLRDLLDDMLPSVVNAARFKVRDINQALSRAETGQPVRARKS